MKCICKVLNKLDRNVKYIIVHNTPKGGLQISIQCIVYMSTNSRGGHFNFREHQRKNH